MTDPLLYTQGMTDNQKLIFMSEFNAQRKDGTTGMLLALILGGVGAHRFYLGQVGLGLVYVLFCVSFIPAIIGLFEAFAMKSRVARYNDRLAADIALRVRALSSGTA